MGVAAKAWVAFILSVLTGLAEIYVGNVYLTIAMMVVTGVGTYLVPNTAPAVTRGPDIL